MDLLVKPAKLGYFAGERDHKVVLAWLFEAEAKVRHYAASDVEAMRVSASYFRGSALNWWRVLAERRRLPATWEEFVGGVKQQFLPSDYARRARDELSALKQVRSVSEYVSEFRNALLACEDVLEAEAFDRFRRGLKAKIAYEVLRMDPPGLEEAIVLALKADDAMRGQWPQLPSRNARTYARPVPMEIGNLSARSVKCYACGEEGHIRRNCPKKTAGKEPGPRGALGHN